nr:methylenetetrahydrofolate reductase [Angustibacter aerolatus]
MDGAAPARAAAPDVRRRHLRCGRLDPRPHGAHHRAHRAGDDAHPGGAPDLRRRVGGRAEAGHRAVRRRRRAQRGGHPRRPARRPERAVAAAPRRPRPRGAAWSSLLRSMGDFCVGVGAFPDKHPESPDLDHDARVLVAKAEAGADFAITRLFLDPAAYEGLVRRLRAAGSDLPVVPGIMPITSLAQVHRFGQLSGVDVPGWVVDELESVGDDPARVRAKGIEPRDPALRRPARRRRARPALLHAEPLDRDARDLRGSRTRGARLR